MCVGERERRGGKREREIERERGREREREGKYIEVVVDGESEKLLNYFTCISPPIQRGYVFRQNPVVKVFLDAPGNNNFGLQLAINTNQFGRTFQDRYVHVALHAHTLL